MTSDAPLVAGIDIGGTNMQIGLVDAAGRIVARRGQKTEGEQGPEHVVARLDAGLRQTCTDASIALDDVTAIGIAAAGAVDIPSGLVLVAPNLGWNDLPLREMVEQRVGRPVVLENDVNAATYGEHRLGAGRGRSGDAMGVWVGTGVGGGLILDGRIYHGNLNTAGEFGLTIVDPDGPRGARTIEDLCSRTGMRRRIAAALAAQDHAAPSPITELCAGDPSRIGTGEIVQAYAAGDPIVCAIVDRAAHLLGVGIASAVTLLALPTVYVGGGISEALGAPWLERVGASFRAFVFPPHLAERCELVMTELAADSGLLGAGMVALDRGVREERPGV